MWYQALCLLVGPHSSQGVLLHTQKVRAAGWLENYQHVTTKGGIACRGHNCRRPGALRTSGPGRRLAQPSLAYITTIVYHTQPAQGPSLSRIWIAFRHPGFSLRVLRIPTCHIHVCTDSTRGGRATHRAEFAPGKSWVCDAT